MKMQNSDMYLKGATGIYDL